MPILCPGAGSLWRLGKHTRHGGQRPSQRPRRPGSRHVSARGTLAHPFTQKQMDAAPAMSPGSAGGVYLGPTEKEKGSSSAKTTTMTMTAAATPQPSAQDKKLAEIRSPTDYYTDGNVFIGQDVAKDDELDNDQSAEQLDMLHPMRSEHRLDDTLNPDGTLASIVFFEETFLSGKFSHLTTSSPSKPVNKSKTLDTTIAASMNRSDFQLKKGKDSTNGVIPSWVRQRRCLPTLDEVDFDQIDIISLHSLQMNDSQPEKNSPDRIVSAARASRTVNVKNAKTSKLFENDIEAGRKYQEDRAVFGDLTNRDNSPVPRQTMKTTGQSAFYKIPKRASARERRNRRNRRTSHNRKIKQSPSRESLVNALGKRNEHAYVNLEYIASIMTNSPPKDGSKNLDESVHIYENVWSKSPAKSVTVQRRLRKSLEGDNNLRMSPSTNRANAATLNCGFAQTSKRSNQGQRNTLEMHSKPDLFVDLPEMLSSTQSKPNSVENRQKIKVALKSYVTGITDTTVERRAQKKETLSSTSSWESATNSHSTEGEECAAILCGAAKNKTFLQKPISRPAKERRQSGINFRNASKTLIDKKLNNSFNRQIPNEGNISVHKDSESNTLIKTPNFSDNAIRNAKIVRTNSIEESPNPHTTNAHADMKTRNSSHIESRRSLPAPSTLTGRGMPKTPQHRSTTNVRAVEAKLSQKQNRKIRPTVEGDESLEALLVQEHSEKRGQEGLKHKDKSGTSTESGETPPGGRSSGDEISRVQRIIEDWNQSAKNIAQRNGSTNYVGGHYHITNKPQYQLDVPQQKPSHMVSNNRDLARNYETKENEGSTNHENDHRKGTRNYQANLRRVESNKSNHSPVHEVPTAYSSLPRTQRRKMNSHNVIEVYVTTQSYTPAEVDEIDAERGEIVVVNSAMQRENDWMWVYVPRTDRFGYLPAFAARPLEFQINEV